MRIDQLQLDLRPRPNWQAVDLGVLLLRQHAGKVYGAWLTLWLPLVALSYGLTFVAPDSYIYMLTLAWWLRPLVERVVILVLSRAVFGEQLSWRQAMQQWPRQLGGGWFRLLTWWRPFMPGRGLYQPIWQLEGARGKFAADRRRVIGRNGASQAAFWFGTACANFELVLQFGIIGLIGIFMSPPEAINPLLVFFNLQHSPDHTVQWALSFLVFAIGGGIIGPIYTAGCFALYLNRRAELEAWDIELMLKQLQQQRTEKRGTRGAVAAVLVLILAIGLVPTPAKAEEVAATCEVPEWAPLNLRQRTPAADPAQEALRKKVDAVYASPELRGYQCKTDWFQKEKKQPEQKQDSQPEDYKPINLPPWLPLVAKYGLIAIGVSLVLWLLYRYRGLLPNFALQLTGNDMPMAVAGHDIRPETLPDDVPAAVRQLWARQAYREALALLYRATLSRLVHDNALGVPIGATEGDCIALSVSACRAGKLPQGRLDIMRTATQLWQIGAYAGRWPVETDVEQACQAWQIQFATPRGAA
ncbi:MAG: hypothetical protein JO142_14725 [Burkholderiales bacterium]|nr:hypothetical protein [Burkholderiales bacterium]